MNSIISSVSVNRVVTFCIFNNIAGRLPENSRNRFVDRKSKKTIKKTDQKKFVFSLRLICYILIKNLYKLLLLLLADL